MMYRVWPIAFALTLGCADTSNTSSPGENLPTETDTSGTEEDGTEGTDEDAFQQKPEGDASSTSGDTQSAEDSEESKGDGSTLETDALPLAMVYANNPLDEETIAVEIPHLTDPNGFLTGKYAKVWNCTQEDGGEVVDFGFGEMTLCNQQQLAQLENGSYLHILPSAWDDGSDVFPELMMYYHVNRIHDYFKGVHGLDSLDFPLTAIVNVQANIALLGGWFPFDNAAFIPEESFAAFPLPLEVGPGGAIIFGQGESIDYAYEADVIYHEYTHAMVGTTRLTGFVKDEFGPDNTPGAMNEGFADYFATTLTNDPVMGEYALSNVGGLGGDGPTQDLRRDLSIFHSCPQDLTTEVHADGLLIGNALWTLRVALGAEVADSIILNAIETFTDDTNFTKAAEAIIAEAELLDPETGLTVQTIFEERGLLGCNRVMDFTGYFIAQGGALPVTLPGTQETDLVPFSSYTPSFLQWKLPVDATTQSIVVEVEGQAGGGFGGFGGGSAELPTIELALKWDGGPILYTYDGTKPAVHNASLIVPMETSEGTQDLTKYRAEFSLPCGFEANDVVFQFHTRSTSGISAYILKSILSDSPLEGSVPCESEEGGETSEEGGETSEEGGETSEEGRETSEVEGGESAEVPFCEAWESTCGEWTLNTPCDSWWTDAVAGEPGVATGANQACYEAHLSLAKSANSEEEVTLNCGYAIGEEPCAD